VDDVAIVDWCTEYDYVCFLGLWDEPIHIVSVYAFSGGLCPTREAAGAPFDFEVSDVVFLSAGSCLPGSFEEVVEDDICSAMLFSWTGVECEYLHRSPGRHVGIKNLLTSRNHSA